MAGIFKKFMWSARQQHTNVVLRLGNADIEMGYENALKMSQALRVAGKAAKQAAGDVSRHWSIVANLADAEDNHVRLEQPNQRFSSSS